MQQVNDRVLPDYSSYHKDLVANSKYIIHLKALMQPACFAALFQRTGLI